MTSHQSMLVTDSIDTLDTIDTIDTLDTLDILDNITLEDGPSQKYHNTTEIYPYRSNIGLEALLVMIFAVSCVKFGSVLYRCGVDIYQRVRISVSRYMDSRKILTMNITDENIEDLLVGECSICLERMSVGDKIMILPCYHNFHKHCVKEWLTTHTNCPLCRHNITENLPRQLLETIYEE